MYVLQYYGTVAKELEYYHKVIVCDGHRTRWKDGDWTDDSDQMILIMRSLVECDGKVSLLGWKYRSSRLKEQNIKQQISTGLMMLILRQIILRTMYL